MIVTTAAECRLECSLGESERTIVGLAAPWNVTAAASTGPVRFEPGSLPVDGPAPKFLRDHDSTKPLGIVVERWADDRGVWFRARVSATAAGDEALVLAADGVLDGVSVGAHPLDYRLEGNTLVVKAAEWRELSLLPFQAFSDARVHEVRAELDPEPQPEPETVTESEENPDMHNEPEIEAAAPIIVTAGRPAPTTAHEYLCAVVNGKLPVQAANQDTGDSAGLIPSPIVEGVYDGLLIERPFVSALGVRAMPGTYGKQFTIPKIVTRPTVGVQAAEFDTGSSTAMVVDPITVTRQSLLGWVNLSEQDVDLTQPSAYQLVIEQLGGAYAVESEEIACLELTSNVTATETVADWTSSADVLTALFTAATDLMGLTGRMPTHMFLSPDRYKDLATLATSGGVPLFPSLNPMNAYGRLDASSVAGSPAGLELVVSPKFAAGTFVVGNRSGMRLYEDRKGAISIAQPSTMSVQVAWRGYFAAKLIDPTQYVALVDL